MPRPPDARVGELAASAGRPIVAGVAPFLRPLLSTRHASDLWTSIEAVAAAPEQAVWQRHRTKLDQNSARRFAAFIGQARQYYSTIGSVDPIAKPLSAYYFALNLAKAYLTAIDPAITEPDNLRHGLSSAFVRKSRYLFQQEQFRIQGIGVFRELAMHTGQGFCWRKGTVLRLVDLMPYLPDGFDLYADAAGEAPKLIQISDCFVLFGDKRAWLRVEVDKNELRQRNIGAESLLTRSRIFGDRFRLVATERTSTYSYESKQDYSYGKKRSEVLADLCGEFNDSLIASNRYFPGNQRYLVLSPREELLSHEAVSFAVLHHLSNMVRYRPHDAERARGNRHFWLFASWIDRACDGYLLAMASRISGEEHVVV